MARRETLLSLTPLTEGVPPAHGEVLLTTDEAAAVLALSPRTLRNWRCLGCGPTAIRLVSSVRHPRSTLDSYIAGLKAVAA